jgi:hypothetical protein
MARTPTPMDISLPNVGGARPVAGYDVSAFGAGGQALARGGERLGAGIENSAEQIAAAQAEQARQQHNIATAQALTEKTALDGKFIGDTGFDDLADRRQAASAAITDKWAATMPPGPIRQNFVATQSLRDAQEGLKGTEAAFKGKASTALANVDQDYGTLIRDIPRMSDTDVSARIDAHNNLVDDLGHNGYLTPDQVQLKKQANAEGIAFRREDTDMRRNPKGWMSDYEGYLSGRTPAGVVSKGETGDPSLGVKSVGNISSDTNGSKSYGFMGLNSGTGSVASFARNYGQQFGLSAKPGSAAFDAQWTAAATGQTAAFRDAQLKYFNEKIVPTISTDLQKFGVPPTVASDPRVQTYFADRSVQMGTLGLQNVEDAWQTAKGDVPRFLRNMNQIDGTPANLQANFHSAIASGVYSAAGHATRLDTRLNGALAATGDQQPSSVMQPGGQQNPSPPGAAGSMRDLIDPLKLDRLYNQARILSHREDTEARIGFSNSLTDDYTEAGHTGVVTTPKTLDDFRNAGFDEEEAVQRFEQYRLTTQMYSDRLKMAGMSPPERQELIASYTPHPGGPPGSYNAQQLRQDALAKVDQAINEATAATDRKERQKALAAFQERVKDSSTEAERTGAVGTSIPRSDFIDNLGEDKGPEAWRTYTRSMQFGSDAASMPNMTAEDRAGMVATWSPQPGEEGYAEKARFQDKIIGVNTAIDTAHAAVVKRQEEMAKVVEGLNKERDGDPAAYTIKYLPAVTDAWGKLQDATQGGGTAINPAAAARDYAVATITEQQRLGVPPDKMDIVPKSYITDLAKAVANPEAEGGADRVAKRLQSEQQLWGDAWPQVFRQISADKGSFHAVVRVVGAGMEDVPGRKLIEMSGMGLKEILKDEHDERAATIQNAVLDAMKPFGATLAGYADRLPIFNDYRSQAEKLAASYVMDGKTAPDAAKQAFEDVLKHKYDFLGGDFGSDSYRIPKTQANGLPNPFSNVEVQNGAEWAKAHLGEVHVDRSNLEAADKALHLTPQERALYERHLTNLVGPGGVNNPDGSRSTLFQTSFETDGKTYNVPTVYDGRILKPDDAIERARKEGLDKFPSYASEDEAEARYQQMHNYMERDTEQHFKGKAGVDLDVVPPAIAPGFREKYLGSAPINTYRRDAVWVTAPGDTGLMLVYGDEAVRTKAGQPLTLTWDQLADMARTHQADIIAPVPTMGTP